MNRKEELSKTKVLHFISRKNEIKKEIEERDKVTQKLRDKLWKIEDEEYLKKVKKVLGNFYLKTHGRGKNKNYIFMKLTGINRRRNEQSQ